MLQVFLEILKLLLPLLLTLFGLTAATGCRSTEAREADPLMYSRAFQEIGATDVQVCIMGGDGNVAGQAYNLMGVHWAVIAKLNPSAVPVERLQPFMPPGTTQGAATQPAKQNFEVPEPPAGN